jgi:DNA-directed RNA polymerase specialized sigma24 family protein
MCRPGPRAGPASTAPRQQQDHPGPCPRRPRTWRSPAQRRWRWRWIPHDVGTVRLEFDDFYRSSWSGVARALSLALGDRDLAVEATDEAMARAYPRWDKISGYDNPAAWVYRVGLNWARSHHRRLARSLPFVRPPVAEPDEVSEPAVRDALMALSFKHRSVVVCRLLLDWSVADTAQALGIRPGTVQSRLHRALQLLESSLQHLRWTQ